MRRSAPRSVFVAAAAGAARLALAVLAAAATACGAATGGSTLEATDETAPAPLATPCTGERSCATAPGADEVAQCEARVTGPCAAEWQAYQDCRTASLGCSASASAALAGELACDAAFDRATACGRARSETPPRREPRPAEAEPSDVTIVDLARLGRGDRVDLLLIVANEGPVPTASLDALVFESGGARFEVAADACPAEDADYAWRLEPGRRSRPLGIRLEPHDDGFVELEIACRGAERVRVRAAGSLEQSAPLRVSLRGTMSDGRVFEAVASPRDL